MIVQLQDALNNCTNFAQLLPIANQLNAKLSFWGSRYIVLDSKLRGTDQNIVGEVSMGAVVERTQQIIKERGFTIFN